MPLTVRVIADYEPMYADPIRVHAGEPISVSREDDEFPGWRWCASGDGREGWVPIELIETSGDRSRIIQTYSAIELAVRAGEDVVVHDSRHQWLFVSNSKGEQGWIPV